MVRMLGYAILFQDSDVVLYRDPLANFRNKELPEFDVRTADDGNGLPKQHVLLQSVLLDVRLHLRF